MEGPPGGHISGEGRVCVEETEDFTLSGSTHIESHI